VGENTVYITGLTADTQYKAYIVVVDAAGNVSAVLTVAGVNPVVGDITYDAVANGEAGTTTSTSIALTFSAAVSDLTAGDITVADATGAATKGTLSGGGTSWSIALTSVTTAGNVSVSIAKSGIESAVKTVTVYKAVGIYETGVTVTTLAGSGTAGFADATGAAAQFYFPYGVAVDSSGNLYVADNNNHRIRKIVIATSEVTTLAGSTQGYTDATGTSAQFNKPWGVATDSSGNLYVADSSNHRIRKIVIATGVVTTLAGSGTRGFADGTGAEAQFSLPYGVAADSSGNLYVADTSNHRIRKITF
jgi:hypothetical protein